MWRRSCLPFRSTWVHLDFTGVRVARSFVSWVMFCRSLFVLLSFFCHCLVCPYSFYDLWFPLWYLQTFLNWNMTQFFSEIPSHAKWTPADYVGQIKHAISPKEKRKWGMRHCLYLFKLDVAHNEQQSSVWLFGGSL